MRRGGNVEEYVLDVRKKRGIVIFGLIDPDPLKVDISKDAIRKCISTDIDVFLVGGSSLVDQYHVDSMIEEIRAQSEKPIVLFPGNVNGLSPKADAVLFILLLNSDDPYYIVGAQILGAPLIHRYGLEVFPTAYIVLFSDSAVAHVGRARGIPPNKPELISMYALAANMFGSRFMYLEGGSGTSTHVPGGIVEEARKSFNGFLMVGGGLRDISSIGEVIASGADGIVLGTVLEAFDLEDLGELIMAARNVGKGRD